MGDKTEKSPKIYSLVVEGCDVNFCEVAALNCGFCDCDSAQLEGDGDFSTAFSLNI